MEVKQLNLQELSAEVLKLEWKVPVVFIGDVGGTNARFGFARFTSKGGVQVAFTRFHMKGDIMNLVPFMGSLVKSLPASFLPNVKAGVLSVPGPVTGGAVGGPFNNLEGLARLADYPTALFPKGRSAIINDLEAGGFGLLSVSDAHAFADYFDVMWEGSEWRKVEKAPAGSVLGKGRCIVMAPGTGLGTSLIYFDAAEDRHGVIPLEAASSTVHPRDDYQFIQDTTEKLGHQPCYEEVVCGKALERYYSVHVGENNLTVPKIAELACQGEPNATKAMHNYNSYLMRLGSEMSMIFVPLTIILVGDNVVRNAAFYSNAKNIDTMRGHALNHGMERFGFQSRTTYLRQKKFLNLNLVGCFRCGLRYVKNEKMVSAL